MYTRAAVEGPRQPGMYTYFAAQPGLYTFLERERERERERGNAVCMNIYICICICICICIYMYAYACTCIYITRPSAIRGSLDGCKKLHKKHSRSFLILFWVYQAAAVHDTLELGGSKKQHKKHRADLFCKWLVNSCVCVCVCVCVRERERERERECVCVLKNKFTIYQVNEFGIEHLRSGSGVLDVAGGRGVITAKAKTKIILLLYEVTTNGTFQNYSFGWSWCYHSKDFVLAHF